MGGDTKLVPSVNKEALGNCLSCMTAYDTWALQALDPVREPLYVAWQADTPERDQFSGELNEMGRVVQGFVDQVTGAVSNAYNAEEPFIEVPI